MEEVKQTEESRKLMLAIVYMSAFIIVLVVLGPDMISSSSSADYSNKQSAEVGGIVHSQMAANSISVQQ